MTMHYRMKNLDCANCAAKMERAISKINGVNAATVSFMTQRLTIDAQDDQFREILRQALQICKKIEPDCDIIL